MTDKLPTARNIGKYHSIRDLKINQEINSIPWIDIHQHTQSMTWNDRNAFDISGCEATVMIAASYYWSPYRPVEASDVQFLWDDALRRAKRFDRSHYYNQHVAIGVHTWSRVDNIERLIAILPEYCELDAVVAIGETGIDSSQHTIQWDIEKQKQVVKEHLKIGKATGLPVIIHTPGGKDSVQQKHTYYYEELEEDFPNSHFDTKTAKLDAVKIDLDLIKQVGIEEDRVLIDHADETIINTVLNKSDCYLGFSVGSPWFRQVDAELVAKVINKYGSDRIVVDTDMLGAMKYNPYTMKELILDLGRLGISKKDIRRVVYENQMQILNLN